MLKKRNPFCVIQYSLKILKEPFAYKIYLENSLRKSHSDLSNIFCKLKSTYTLTLVERNFIFNGIFNSAKRSTFYNIRSMLS